jgi:hypothetical protein
MCVLYWVIMSSHTASSYLIPLIWPLATAALNAFAKYLRGTSFAVWLASSPRAFRVYSRIETALSILGLDLPSFVDLLANRGVPTLAALKAGKDLADVGPDGGGIPSKDNQGPY